MHTACHFYYFLLKWAVTLAEKVHFFSIWYFSSIKCKECDEGYLLPSSNLDQEASHWLCAKCGTRLESNDVESILEGMKAMADMAETAHSTIPDVIAKLAATLHPNHYIIFDLKETYVSSSQVMLITGGGRAG